MNKKVLILCQDYKEYFAKESELFNFFVRQFKSGFGHFHVLTDNSYSKNIFRVLSSLQSQFNTIDLTNIEPDTFNKENFSTLKSICENADKIIVFAKDTSAFSQIINHLKCIRKEFIILNLLKL